MPYHYRLNQSSRVTPCLTAPGLALVIVYTQFVVYTTHTIFYMQQTIVINN